MSPRDTGRRFAAITSRGCRRRANEDTLGLLGGVVGGEPALPLGGLLEGPGSLEGLNLREGPGPLALVLSDGMGGHPHGALASREVVCDLMADTTRLATPEGCAAAVRQAHLHLHDLMLRRPETLTMGATVAGVALTGDAFCWFNVGDSRIYRMRGQRLEQLGHDDRAATPAGAGRPSHEIAQCLGGQRAIAPIHPHVGAARLLPGDSLLVCSDGLTDMVADHAIAALLSACADADEACAGLLQAALCAGGLDNVSVILVR